MDLLGALVSQSLDAFSALQQMRGKTREDVFVGSFQLDINEGMEIGLWAIRPRSSTVRGRQGQEQEQGQGHVRATYGVIEDAINALPIWGRLWEVAGRQPKSMDWTVVVEGQSVVAGWVLNKRALPTPPRPPLSPSSPLQEVDAGTE